MTHHWPPPWSLLLVLGTWLLTGLAAPAASHSIPLLDLDASRCTLLRALSPTLPAPCQGLIPTFDTGGEFAPAYFHQQRSASLPRNRPCFSELLKPV